MGIHDRQYYRDEESARGGFDASNTTMITKIIVATFAVYFLDLFIGGREHWLMQQMASNASDLWQPWYWWRFLASGASAVTRACGRCQRWGGRVSSYRNWMPGIG